MSLRLKVYGLLGVLAVAGAAAYLYKSQPQWLGTVVQAKPAAKTGNAPEKPAVPVELAVARQGAISSFVASTANLRADREVAVSTQAEGIVQKLHVEEGDFVKEGQLLCALDDTQLQIRLRLAEEKLAQAALQAEKARIRQEKAGAQIGHNNAELIRYEKAAKEGLVSDKEVAAYKYKLDELTHDQKAAEYETRELQHRISELNAEIAQSKLEISRTRITAPFAGFITQRMLSVGQRIKPLDTLFNLGSFSQLYADVHVSERDARTIRPLQTASVRLGSDDTAAIAGKVQRISPVVDQASGTVKVTIAMNHSPGFRPGAFVRVDIKIDTKPEAILIPKRALIEEDGQNYVFIAAKDTATRTKVDLGYQTEGVVEVVKGVRSGQSVVVAGQGALKEGSKIKVLSTQNDVAPRG